MKTKLSVLTVAILIASSYAQANDKADVRQQGDENYASVTQTNTTDVVADVDQFNNKNEAIVKQIDSGAGTVATVSQRGNNEADSLQDTTFDSSVTIDQKEKNEATARQLNSTNSTITITQKKKNRAFVVQEGIGSTVDVKQGVNNDSWVKQIADNGTVIVDQLSAQNSDADAFQTGDNSIAFLNQRSGTANSSIWVQQYGAGSHYAVATQDYADSTTSGIYQAGSSQYALVEQFNTNSSYADVDQYGRDNEAAVLQAYGDANTFVSGQAGSENMIDASYRDSTPGGFDGGQLGNNNRAQLYQLGNTNYLAMKQSGSDTAIVYHIGSANTTYIRQ